MRFLVALCLFYTVSCSVVRVDECAWGESYWCSNIKTAVKCGAFDHCFDAVWSKNQPQKDSTDICEFCENIIKDVRALVDDKDNQKQVKDFLDDACNILPNAELSQLCTTTVNDYFDQVIQMIDSELDPATVCSTMGLCAGFKDQVNHAPVSKSMLKEGTTPGEFCEAIIKDIRAFVDDKNNQEQVKTMLDNICNVLPDELQQLCKDELNTNLQQIIAMIDSELDPDVCKQLHAYTSVTKKQPAKVSTDLCGDCKMFFTMVKSKMTSATTEDEVKKMIEDDLCSKMGQYKDVCTLAVNTYLPEIFQMLSSDVDPATICSSLRFCESTKDARSLLAKMRVKNVFTSSVPAGSAAGVGSAEGCLLCETILGELQNMDRDKTNQEEIEAFLKKNLCGLLGSLEAVCDSTVDEFAPELFELLVNELDPKERCAELGFCSQKNSVEHVLRFAAPVPKSAPPKIPIKPVTADPPSSNCVLCEFVIKELDQEIGNNATEKDIVAALDKICNVLPDTVKETCYTFVNQYGPTVIALLLQELDPQQVCTKLGLCKAELKASTECVLCEFVINELDTILENNATEAEILSALDKVCSILPSTITDECVDFVNTYGPAVVALLEQELEPQQICTLFGLCSGAKKVVLKTAVRDPEVCGVCETVIQYVDSLLEENATIKELEQVLDKVCNFLPKNIQQECDDMVKTYGPALVQLITQFADPREICTSIGLCSNQTKELHEVQEMIEIVPAKAHLLGENECTYGPAFWCLNMENALKCNKVDHCKKSVWN